MNGAEVIGSGATQGTGSCAEYEGKDQIRFRCAVNATVTMIQMEKRVTALLVSDHNWQAALAANLNPTPIHILSS